MIPRSAPSSARNLSKPHTNTDSEISDDNRSEESIDESACMPMAKIIQSQALPMRHIQPARKVKDAAVARQKAMAQKILVAQKLCRKKRPVVVAAPQKKEPPAPKKACPAPKKCQNNVPVNEMSQMCAMS